MNKFFRPIRIISLCVLMVFGSLPENVSAFGGYSIVRKDAVKNIETEDNLSEYEGEGVLEDDQSISSDFYFQDEEFLKEDLTLSSSSGEVEASDEFSKPFEQKVYIDGVTVIAKADAGVLPDNSSLSVKKVVLDERNSFQRLFNLNASEDETKLSQQDLDSLTSAVEASSSSKEVAFSYIFDIEILDSFGREIQPNGLVSISFVKDISDNRKISSQITHISDDGNFSVSQLSTSVKETKDYVISTATTDGFSYFKIEFNYDTYTYLLEVDTLEGGE